MGKREKHKGCSYGGFVGLNDEYIEGIFVSDDERVIIRTKLEKPSKIKGLALI